PDASAALARPLDRALVLARAGVEPDLGAALPARPRLLGRPARTAPSPRREARSRRLDRTTARAPRDPDRAQEAPLCERVLPQPLRRPRYAALSAAVGAIAGRARRLERRRHRGPRAAGIARPRRASGRRRAGSHGWIHRRLRGPRGRAVAA